MTQKILEKQAQFQVLIRKEGNKKYFDAQRALLLENFLYNKAIEDAFQRFQRSMPTSVILQFMQNRIQRSLPSEEKPLSEAFSVILIEYHSLFQVHSQVDRLLDLIDAILPQLSFESKDRLLHSSYHQWMFSWLWRHIEDNKPVEHIFNTILTLSLSASIQSRRNLGLKDEILETVLESELFQCRPYEFFLMILACLLFCSPHQLSYRRAKKLAYFLDAFSHREFPERLKNLLFFTAGCLICLNPTITDQVFRTNLDRPPSQLLCFLEIQIQQIQEPLPFQEIVDELAQVKKKKMSNIAELQVFLQLLEELLSRQHFSIQVSSQLFDEFIADDFEKYLHSSLVWRLTSLLSALCISGLHFSKMTVGNILRCLELGAHKVPTAQKFIILKKMLGDNQITLEQIHSVLDPQEREQFWEVEQTSDFI